MTTKNNKTKIVFTGGGTAGHVTPNLAIIEEVQKQDVEAYYIGSKHGIEAQLLKKTSIPFYSITAGKLRRYFSFKNFTDVFKIFWGTIQAFFILGKIKPNKVFSKGGFVAFPVVFAAWLRRIPVIIHESDLTPGLANKLSLPFASHVCVSFEKTKSHLHTKKPITVTGTPIRKELFEGNRKKGLEICHLSDDKPCVLVIGGSKGSEFINKTIREGLDKLLPLYNIIHLCGEGNVISSIKREGYCQLAYAGAEMKHLFAAADMIISRAGANVLSEIMALKKPHILIPLGKSGSRGDQLHNARYYAELGASLVLPEEEMTLTILLELMKNLWRHKEKYTDIMKEFSTQSAVQLIVSVLLV